MQEGLDASPARMESTDVRFSVRSLLIGTIPIAILAAVVSPLIRGLEREQLSRLIALWVSLSLGLIATLAYQARKRRQAEKKTGATILRLPTFDERAPGAGRGRRWLNYFATLLLGVMFFAPLHLLVFDVFAVGLANIVILFAFNGALSVWWISRGIVLLWWRRAICFGELGILWDTQLLTSAQPMAGGRPTEARIRPVYACTKVHFPGSSQ